MDQSDIRGLAQARLSAACLSQGDCRQVPAQAGPDQSHHEHVPSRARLSSSVSPAAELPVTKGRSPITLIVPAPKVSPSIQFMLVYVQSGFGGGVIEKTLFFLIQFFFSAAVAQSGTGVASPR